MDCDTAREALSARIDGEREPVPALTVDEHLADCEPCRRWQAAAVEQTQLLRRLAGRSQLAAVRTPEERRSGRLDSLRSSWQRWALGAVGVLQLALAVAQGAGFHLGVPHAAMGGHVLNESTAWSAALGVVMIVAAMRPQVAGGLTWVLAAFIAVLSFYVISDAMAGRVTLDRALTHLPVVAGAVLAWLVWRRDPAGDPAPHNDAGGADDLGLQPNRSGAPVQRGGQLRPSDGSAA